MEKRSDISRDSFRPEQGYTSVRLQQGRPQLDADWNEQMELQLQRERTALYDILGSAASGSAELQPSPRSYQGFQVEMDLVGVAGQATLGVLLPMAGEFTDLHTHLVVPIRGGRRFGRTLWAPAHGAFAPGLFSLARPGSGHGHPSCACKNESLCAS